MLEYYQKEREQFKTEFETTMSDEEARYVFTRLKKRYHLHRDLEFYGNGGGGRCGAWYIRLSHTPSVGIMAHEIAHAIHHRKKVQGKIPFNSRSHTRRHRAIMRRVARVIMARLEKWRGFVAMRSTKRAESLEEKVTREQAEEVRRATPQYKLEHLRALEKRALTRAKRAQTQLKKVRRKIKIWERKAVADVKKPLAVEVVSQISGGKGENTVKELGVLPTVV